MHRERTTISFTLLWIALGVATTTGQPVGPQSGTPTIGQVESGSVVGTVSEVDGTPLTRVTVLIEGPDPFHDQQLRRVGDRGQFQFTDLQPGLYHVAVQLPGLSAGADVEVNVEAGKRVQANITLSLFAYEVTVDVKMLGDVAELVVSDSTAGLSILPNRTLAMLPLPAEQALEALPFLPGVVRGPGGLISIGGTLPTDSAFLLNGADLGDAYSGGYRMQIPLEAVDAVRLRSGVSPAAYGDMLGGVIDLTTRAGSNDWEFEIGSPIPRPWLRGGTIRGIRRFSPRLRFSGPLVKDKLFLSQSVEYRFSRDRIEDAPHNSGTHVRKTGGEVLTQIDWLPSNRQHSRFVLLAFPQTDVFAGLSGVTPIDSTSKLDSDAVALLFDNQTRLDSKSFVQTTLQFNSIALDAEPISEFPPTDFVLRPDRSQGTTFNSQDHRTKHWQLKSVYTRAVGPDAPRHVLQFGGEIHRLSIDGDYTNRDITVVADSGRQLRRVDFVGDGHLDGSKYEWAMFLQDRFKPSDRFWIDAGVRLSHDDATSGIRTAPRLGIAWDPFADSRTLVKASAGILYRRILLGEMLWEQLPTRVETRLAPDGSGATVVLPPRLDANLESPRAFLTTFEVSHRFNNRLVIHARYSRRESRNQLVFDIVEHDPLALAPGQDPVSRLPPAAESLGGALLLSNSGSTSYREIAVSANIRIADNDQVFLSYTHSSNDGDLNDFNFVAGARPDAILRPNQDARLGIDTPNRVVIWGTLHLPWELIAAPVIEWRNGFPFSILALDQSYLGDANTERFPDYLAADLQLTKGFQFSGRKVRAGLLFRNITGHFNPRDVVGNSASPRFGEFLNSRGARIRLRFSAVF